MANGNLQGRRPFLNYSANADRASQTKARGPIRIRVFGESLLAAAREVPAGSQAVTFKVVREGWSRLGVHALEFWLLKQGVQVASAFSIARLSSA